jgi:CO/xanthine dehydrogenase FAD-binding subunit
VPLRRGTFGFGYERFARTSNDYALATVCAVARRDGDVVRDVRLVVGAISGRPWRAESAEALLEGLAPTPDRLAAAAALLAREARIAPNFRSDAAYRRKLLGVLALRALESTATWALRED